MKENKIGIKAVYDKVSSGYYGYLEYANGNKVTCRVFSPMLAGAQVVNGPEKLLSTMTASGNSIFATRDPTKPTTQQIIKALSEGAPSKTRHSWVSVTRFVDGEESRVLRSMQKSQRNLAKNFPVAHPKEKLMKVTITKNSSSELTRVPPPANYNVNATQLPFTDSNDQMEP